LILCISLLPLFVIIKIPGKYWWFLEFDSYLVMNNRFFSNNNVNYITEMYDYYINCMYLFSCTFRECENSYVDYIFHKTISCMSYLLNNFEADYIDFVNVWLETYLSISLWCRTEVFVNYDINCFIRKFFWNLFWT
jgi:hypothetical protein